MNSKISQQQKTGLWWIPALILLSIGFPIALYGMLFMNIALFGLKGGPSHSTFMISAAAVAGLWSLMIAVSFRKHLQTGGFWLAGIAFLLWTIADMTADKTYMLPLPYIAIIGVVAWIAFAKIYKAKRSKYFAIFGAILIIIACTGLFLLAEGLYKVYYNSRQSETTTYMPSEPTILQDEPATQGVDMFYIDANAYR